MSTTVRVAALDDLKPGTAMQVTVADHRIALVRIDDDVYALSDVCSHQDVSLSEGEVFGDEKSIECWKHGSTFSLTDGSAESLPATKPVPVYEARVVDGEIEVTVP